MSQPPNPSERKQDSTRLPIADTCLEYQGTADPAFEPRLHKGFQFLLGLGFVYAYTATSVFAVFVAPDTNQITLGWLAAAVGITGVILIRIKARWTVFVPGVLVGILSIPIGFFTYCALFVRM